MAHLPHPHHRIDLSSDDADALFRRMTLGVAAIMVAYIAVRGNVDGRWDRFIAPGLILLGTMMAWGARWQGKRRLSFIVYVWSVWLAVTCQTVMGAGVMSAANHGHVVLMALAGWLLGTRQTLLLAAASAVVMLGWRWRRLPADGPRVTPEHRLVMRLP